MDTNVAKDDRLSVRLPTQMEATSDWVQKLRRARGLKRRAEEIPLLTDQFFVTLRAYATEVEETADKQPRRALERMRRLLDHDELNWLDAYEVEQQLVHLMPEAKMRTELLARKLEAQQVLSVAKSSAYAAECEKATSTERQRSLLARLVNDLQWTYTVNEVKRCFWGDLTRRTAWLVAGCAAAFIAALFLVRAESGEGMWRWLSTGKDYSAFGWRCLLLACAAGASGASFSMLIGLRKVNLDAVSLDQLKILRGHGVFIGRVCIGIGGALVVLGFMASDLLKGALFPNFQEALLVGGLGKNAVLLAIWSFIAGFSEKLALRLLADAEQKAATAPADRQPGDVGRPGRGKGQVGKEKDEGEQDTEG